MSTYHPQLNENGQLVLLKHPSSPTPLFSWTDANAVATVVPDGPLPHAINGVPLSGWKDVPNTNEEWAQVDGQCAFEEPPFHVPKGKMPAAGVVIREPDDRIWLIAPSNAHAGYKATFPKGRVDHGVNLQACAIREAFEEAGLKVRIIGWLADSNRSHSYTRYYLAERTGGNPAAMGWESQAVHLVPRSSLKDFLTHHNDLPLLQAIQALPTSGLAPNSILQQGGGNFERIRIAIARFREQYGRWPTGLALGGQTFEAIKHQLTPSGYATLAGALVLRAQIKNHLILAHDDAGNQFDYATDQAHNSQSELGIAEVDRWIWGVTLDTK